MPKVDPDLMTKAEYKIYRKETLKKRAKILGITAAILAVLIGVISLVSSFRGKQEQDRIKNIVAGIQTDTLALAADYDTAGDDDNDGINNGEEEKLATNYQEKDTDRDGICDGDELKVGTDPTKSDTDGDGLLDGYELMVGLDPLKASTDGSTPDGQRIFEIKREYANATLIVKGSANLSDTVFDNLDLVGFKNNTGIVSDAMSFYTDYSFISAEISFKVDAELLSNKNVKLENLSIYKFNAQTQEFEKVDSVIDSSAMTVSAEITECATYLLGKTTVIGEPPVMRIQLLIDNSGSMYPEEMCAGSEENDVEFKRLDLSANIIDMVSSDSLIGISKFTATYTELADFTTDHSSLKKTLDRIKTDKETFNGTDFQTAILSAINEFDNTDGNYSNMIIMLCDGNSTDRYETDPEKIIKAANDNNIIVLMIGLGQSVDAQRMQQIAEGTGGKYYTAANADALDEVFTQIETTFNYDITSYGTEGKSGYMIANTGFVPATNGFSFGNFRTTTSNGTCFGMAMFARDWYTGSLALKLEDYKPQTNSKNVYDAQGYDLSGTSIEAAYKDKKDMYSLSVSAVKSNEYTDLMSYLDFDNSGGLVLQVKSDILAKAQKVGFGSVNYEILDLGLNWRYVQLLAIDVQNNSAAIESTYGKDEAALYKALLRYHVLQWEDVENCRYKLSDGRECFDRIEELLLEGIPAVLMLGGNHAVNAISLIQDSDCPRRFILQIYDNNYPGEIREITIEKIVTGVFSGGSQIDIVYSYVAVYDSENISVTLYDTPTK